MITNAQYLKHISNILPSLTPDNPVEHSIDGIPYIFINSFNTSQTLFKVNENLVHENLVVPQKVLLTEEKKILVIPLVGIGIPLNQIIKPRMKTNSHFSIQFIVNVLFGIASGLRFCLFSLFSILKFSY